MAKDSKKRKLNKLLKRKGVGMKWKKFRGSQEDWQVKVSDVSRK